MADGKADWTILRVPFVVFVVSVIVSAGMVSGSHYFRQNMERQYEANHSRFRHASQQYLSVDEEERIIDDFYPQFVRLYRAGLLGKERRLSWLETLRAAGDAIKIPQLSYKLEAQRPAAPEQHFELGHYSLFVSPMNLSLGLLHEDDLLQLLQALDRHALGQYSVKSCVLKRDAAAFDLTVIKPNITAVCLLDWWTINLGGARELSL